MKTRYTDAIPLAPRPDLEQYKRLAKELLDASQTNDESALRSWAAGWLDRLARLLDASTAPTPADRTTQQLHLDEADRILRDAESTRLLTRDASLADAQFFLARLHGFDSWPKFSAHVDGLR